MEEALDAPEIADVAAWARARTSLFARKKRLEADEADPKDERDDDNEIDDVNVAILRYERLRFALGRSCQRGPDSTLQILRAPMRFFFTQSRFYFCLLV